MVVIASFALAVTNSDSFLGNDTGGEECMKYDHYLFRLIRPKNAG
jgi:hypothetical protein